MKPVLIVLLGSSLALAQSNYPSQKADAEKAMDACRQTGATQCTIVVNPPVIGYQNGQPIYGSGAPIVVHWERPKETPQPRVVYSPYVRGSRR